MEYAIQVEVTQLIICSILLILFIITIGRRLWKLFAAFYMRLSMIVIYLLIWGFIFASDLYIIRYTSCYTTAIAKLSKDPALVNQVGEIESHRFASFRGVLEYLPASDNPGENRIKGNAKLKIAFSGSKGKCITIVDMIQREDTWSVDAYRFEEK